MKVQINKNDDHIYTFKSTGRELTSSSGLISVKDGKVYDCYGDPIDDLTAEEKKDLALYMIEKWGNFGGIILSF